MRQALPFAEAGAGQQLSESWSGAMGRGQRNLPGARSGSRGRLPFGRVFAEENLWFVGGVELILLFLGMLKVLISASLFVFFEAP